MVNATLLFGVLLILTLAAIAWVDWRRMIIPDRLNLALAGAGLLFQAWASPGRVWLHALTGTGLFVAFWLVRRIHRRATGRVGLGLGDVKMAGAAGIWLSPPSLPGFVFCASVAGLAFALGRRLLGQGDQHGGREPFGPFLAIGLLLAWTGEQLLGQLP